MRTLRLLAIPLIVSLGLAACGSTATARRVGVAGASLVVIGAGTTTYARHGADPNRPTSQRALISTGVAAQVIGVGMMIYALDWIMQREAEEAGVPF